jgi:glycosyltransferase involved in cell wall biosynthesis
VAVPDPLTVAYTLEQCWHRVPGGTAIAALRVAQAMGAIDDVRLVGVAGWHRRPPAPAYTPPIAVRRLPGARPALYESWLRIGQPRVELATGDVDVAHATTVIPCPSKAPLVSTVHDLAWRHAPEQFTKRGVDVFDRSLTLVRRKAAIVLCSSQATIADCIDAGLDATKLRHVPLGVDATPVAADDVARVRRAYGLPDEHLLFVGTLEPRKNLRRLVEAHRTLPDAPPLTIIGAAGWGDGDAVGAATAERVRFLGFVPSADLSALYASASALCYPSLREGYGLPVLEAMAQGTPVVTSRGTSTEEAAGGAAVLVDPLDVESIAAGIAEALERADQLAALGRSRAAEATWAATARATAAAYREAAA